MLSAANDLMARVSEADDSANLTRDQQTLDYQASVAKEIDENTHTPVQCNELSTSAILLADIIPALCVQIIYPIFLVSLPTAIKLIAGLTLACASYIITGHSTDLLTVMLGACAASMACGLGESTFVSSTPAYGTGSLIGWSVGTGFAGLSSALAYAILRMLLPIRLTMILMLVIPVIMLVAYLFILVPVDPIILPIEPDLKKPSPKDFKRSPSFDPKASQRTISSTKSFKSIKSISIKVPAEIPKIIERNWKDSLWFLLSLFKYTTPIFVVYMSAYLINQGLIELCYFEDVPQLDKAAQYRWLQVAYQLGSLLSRSSILFFRFKNLWLMAVLQPINAALIFAHATNLMVLPSFFIAVSLVFFEGTLTGFSYANTYYNMRLEVAEERQKLAVSIVVVANSLGILTAAIVAMPVHDHLCQSLYKPKIA